MAQGTITVSKDMAAQLLETMDMPEQVHGRKFVERARRVTIHKKHLSLLPMNNPSNLDLPSNQQFFELAAWDRVADAFITVATAIRDRDTGYYYIYV